jgi:hypothetical protein
MADHDRTWWPFAVPAVLAVALVSLTFAFGGSGATQPPLACPRSIPTSTDRPSVPDTKDPVDTEGRLAPDRLPTKVVVCFYAGDGKGAQPLRKPLTGSKALTGQLDAMVDTIAYLPPKIASQAHCPTRLVHQDDPEYLLGLTYLDGVEWISTVDSVCSPTPTTNGSFDSSALLATELQLAYRSGSWPTPDPRRACLPRGMGRRGQQSSVVPDGYSSLDVCRTTAGTDVTAEIRPSSGDTHDIVAALNALPTSPMTGPGDCFGWYASGAEDVGYRLVFHYPIGADAAVDVETGPDCHPPISNGSLQSSDLSALLPLLERLTS